MAYGLIALRQLEVQDGTRVPCVVGGFLTSGLAREIPIVIRFILALLFVFYYSVAALSVFTWPCF